MKCFSNRSSNRVFNFFYSIEDILYGAMETDTVMSTKSIENYTSFSEGIEVMSSGNTFGNSFTTGIKETYFSMLLSVVSTIRKALF